MTLFNCRDISERATDYQENRISWRERLNWKLHLLICRDCQRFVSQFLVMVRALQRPLPETTEKEMQDQLRRIKEARP